MENKNPSEPQPVEQDGNPLQAIGADLREEAKRRGFTREELETAIKSRRSERKSDAA